MGSLLAINARADSILLITMNPEPTVLLVAPIPQINTLQAPSTKPQSSSFPTSPPLRKPPTTAAGSYCHTSSAAYPSSPAPAAVTSDRVHVPLVHWPLPIPLWPFARTGRPTILFSKMLCWKRSRDEKEWGGLQELGGEGGG